MSALSTTPAVFIASDHAGFELKERLIKNLTLDWPSFNLPNNLPKMIWQDLGPFTDTRVDYPDFADLVASRVKENGGQGVLICGSGQGMAIRANRYLGVRAALCWNEESTGLSREHNDANVLCLGGRLLDHDLCERMVQVFLTTAFAGERHKERVRKLDAALKL